MRIRWRGMELPGRVVPDYEVNNDFFGRFVIEPFEQGFGTTIGNSLRRVLLSSLEGAAVTTVKIAGVAHEFSTIEGVLEDVTDILLNIKGIVLRLDDVEQKTMRIERDTAGEVRAGDIETDPAVTIVNKDHLIATLTADVPFSVEMTVQTGRGYETAADNRPVDADIGVIPIDSSFSPVRRVRYRTEAMRVGQKTNYDRLILEVWSDGTIKPEDSIVEAGMILRKHLNPFVMYHELGKDEVPATVPSDEDIESPVDAALEDLLNKQVSVLNLSVRANNCLEAARVGTLRDLVTRTEADLLRVRSFGKTSLHEVQRKLADVGLRLGMRTGDAAHETATEEQSAASFGQGASIGGSAFGTGTPISPFPGASPTGAPESEPTAGQVPSGAAEGGDSSDGTTQSGPMAAFSMEE